VRRITRADDGQLAFDGKGQTVDWVVEMRRFAQDELFSETARSGRLSEALMIELAECIVDFHHRAEPRPEHGGREGIAEVISINERSFVATGLPVDDLVAASSNALGQLAPLLEARRKMGHVRVLSDWATPGGGIQRRPWRGTRRSRGHIAVQAPRQSRMVPAGISTFRVCPADSSSSIVGFVGQTSTRGPDEAEIVSCGRAEKPKTCVGVVMTRARCASHRALSSAWKGGLLVSANRKDES
jgi:hypothetical protein